MRAWMWALAIGLMFSGACKKKGAKNRDRDRDTVVVTGMPESGVCGWNEHVGTCIADSKVYTCVEQVNEIVEDNGCDKRIERRVACVPKDLPTPQ